MSEISWDDFASVELRIGTIIEVAEFPEARKRAWKLRWITGAKSACGAPRHKLRIYMIAKILWENK